MQKKIPIGILGATGTVGQKLIELLSDHPFFEIVAIGASKQSSGKLLQDVFLHTHIQLNQNLLNTPIQDCIPNFPCKIVFSALDSKVAKDIEQSFKNHGYLVISNASNHRLDLDVPLIIPEINPDHLDLIDVKSNQGHIIANPNCSTIGLCLALKPLHDQFEIENVHVTTLQAISGAGYPGVASLDILDNVIPHIDGEEEKIQTEPLKIFGRLKDKQIKPSNIKISAHCNRVPVQDGHLECVSIKFKTKPQKEELIRAWNDFSGLPQKLKLPLAPIHPIIYLDQPKSPQPKVHRHLGKGMSVVIGRLRECPLFDYKFVCLSHNTIRGAAGSTILIGELLYKLGLIHY